MPLPLAVMEGDAVAVPQDEEEDSSDAVGALLPDMLAVTLAVPVAAELLRAEAEWRAEKESAEEGEALPVAAELAVAHAEVEAVKEAAKEGEVEREAKGEVVQLVVAVPHALAAGDCVAEALVVSVASAEAVRSGDCPSEGADAINKSRGMRKRPSILY